jgi:hypothetical protein
MVETDMRRSPAVAKKIRATPRSKNRVREEEQLYLLQECSNREPVINAGVAQDDGGLHVLKSQEISAGWMRRYVPSPSNGHYGQVERNLLYRRFAKKLVINSRLTRRVVSFQASKQRPFYRWLKYKEAFSPDLVDYLFDVAALPQNNGIQILDPFAGTGTALTRAVARKWKATGIEVLPIGAYSLKARLVADRVSAANFNRAFNRLNKIDWKIVDSDWRFPHLPITQSAFSARTEKEMSMYIGFVRRLRDPDVRYLFWFAALSVLEDVSFTRKDGQYLRWDYRSGRKLAKRFDKGPVPPFSTAIRQRLREFGGDLESKRG